MGGQRSPTLETKSYVRWGARMTFAILMLASCNHEQTRDTLTVPSCQVESQTSVSPDDNTLNGVSPTAWIELAARPDNTPISWTLDLPTVWNTATLQSVGSPTSNLLRFDSDWCEEVVEISSPAQLEFGEGSIQSSGTLTVFAPANLTDTTWQVRFEPGAPLSMAESEFLALETTYNATLDYPISADSFTVKMRGGDSGQYFELLADWTRADSAGVASVTEGTIP